jgi:hypothetical protein
VKSVGIRRCFSLCLLHFHDTPSADSIDFLSFWILRISPVVNSTIFCSYTQCCPRALESIQSLGVVASPRKLLKLVILFFDQHLSIALTESKIRLSTQLAAMVGPPTKRQKRSEVPEGQLPQKKFFRQRAHANPFSDHNLTYPESPAAFDWAELYPAYAVKEDKENTDASATQEKRVGKISKQVEVADIGCGFGGLLFALAPIMPDTLLLGTL